MIVEGFVQSDAFGRSAETETASKSRKRKAFEAQNFQAGRRNLNKSGRACPTVQKRSLKNEEKEAFTRTGSHNLSGYTRKEYYLTRVAREGYEGQLTVQAKSIRIRRSK